MKQNIISLVIAAFCAVLFAGGCCSSEKSSYNLVLLGDVHYDKIEFHKMPAFDTKIPWNLCLDEKGIFTWRNHNRWMNKAYGNTAQNYPINVRMWKEDLPYIIKRAAENGAENNALYTIQLGDMIHGDCGTLDLHKKNLQEALDYLKNNSSSPLLVVCGNHDPRGPFGQQAWNEVMLPYFDSVKNVKRENTNYFIRIGRDLYYFHDAMNPDFEYLKQTLNANKDARYIFFLSHVPLFAMAKNHINEPLAENFDALLAMLAEHKAIVLSGHTHWISLTQYRHEGKKIDQFVLNSTMRKPERDSVFNPENNISKDEFSVDYGGRIALWNKYADKITTPLNAYGAGHALLRVAEDGVFVDFYSYKSDKVHTYKLR